MVLVGTSGWHYPTGRGTWNGVFYPRRRPKGFDELTYYADHFQTVEVNSTFYRVPEPDVARGWLRRTPPAFEFSVKLYQKFTHPDMFLERQGVAEWDVTTGDLDQFRAGIDPLAEAGRLTAVLLQFPPSFHRDDAALGYMDWLLTALRAYPLAVELRHHTWSDQAPETRAALDAHRAAWVIIDEPKFESSIRQELDAAGGSSAAPLVYYRFHGRNRAQWWEHEHADDRYNYLYSPEELQPFATVAKSDSTAGRKVVMYMNNHFSAKAVANAAVLRHQLGDLVPGDYPREMIRQYPDLEAIVRSDSLPI